MKALKGTSAMLLVFVLLTLNNGLAFYVGYRFGAQQEKEELVDVKLILNECLDEIDGKE